MNEYLELCGMIPPMLNGLELRRKMDFFPEYDPSIIKADSRTRLEGLETIPNLYICSSMGEEVYSKLYLAMMRSMRKRASMDTIRQRNSNYIQVRRGRTQGGIMGGTDSFSIIGEPGIGKSCSVERAIHLCSPDDVLTCGQVSFIPILTINTSFDSTTRGMFSEILSKIDGLVGTDYSATSQKSRVSGASLIGIVSQALLNHVGVLVLEEIQSVIAFKAGRTLIGALTQLVNSSGVAIVMVGTPECDEFFMREMYLARRSVGLRYTNTEYNDFYIALCKYILEHPFVRNPVIGQEGITKWLYEHSGGNPSITVSMLMAVQETTILSGEETIDIPALRRAYIDRMFYLQPHIQGKEKSLKRPQKTEQIIPAKQNLEPRDIDLERYLLQNRNTVDIARRLLDFFHVEEVATP